jgi:hypothetical protein
MEKPFLLQYNKKSIPFKEIGFFIYLSYIKGTPSLTKLPR